MIRDAPAIPAPDPVRPGLKFVQPPPQQMSWNSPTTFPPARTVVLGVTLTIQLVSAQICSRRYRRHFGHASGRDETKEFERQVPGSVRDALRKRSLPRFGDIEAVQNNQKISTFWLSKSPRNPLSEPIHSRGGDSNP